MNSFIFASHACKSCDAKPFERHERCILRTETEDICGTCGSVIQKFPEMTGFAPAKDSISIPPAVSQLLARLLKQRLFIFDRGIQPRRVDRTVLDVERMAKTLAHRAGDQVYITLRGPGNCSAELRWSYSTRSLLPKFPWQELAYTGGQWPNCYREKTELKPALADLETQRPPRIVRACHVLSDFHFMGLYVDNRWPTHKSLRFEQRTDVETQVLDTTQDLCLVIKAELQWLQVGSCFPDESGPRIYNLSAHYQGYPVTLEEAIDLAIDSAMSNIRGENVSIHHERDRCRTVASAGNPLASARSCAYYSCAAAKVLHNSHLIIRGGEPSYKGPFHTDDGRNLMPAGFLYDLEVDMPRPPAFHEDHKHPVVSVTVTGSQNVIAEQTFGGEGYSGGYSTFSYRIGYRLDLQEKLPTEAGQTVTIRITDSAGTEEKTYSFVTLKEYEAAWEAWRNPIIDRYKVALAAQIEMGNAAWEYREVNTSFQNGQVVAALIENRWLEATYCGSADKKAGGGYVVIVSARQGEVKWEVASVKPLEDALMEGLHVVAPYNAKAPVGTQAICIGKVEPPVTDTPVTNLVDGSGEKPPSSNE